MDRMELKKRWLMGTVHPELFYLPWGHKKDKHIIKIVSAWIDVSNLNYAHDGTTIFEAYNYDDNKELVQSTNDVIEAKVSSKALGIKIYDNNQYIGGFAVINITGYHSSISLKPNNNNYTSTILCGYDREISGYSSSPQTMVNAYTRLLELPPAIKNMYIKDGLSNPKPYMTQNTAGLHGIARTFQYRDTKNEFAVYAHSTYCCSVISNLISPRISGIGMPYFNISAGCERNITTTWNLVNVRDKLTNNWINGDVKRQIIETETLYSTAYISRSYLSIFNSDINTTNISIETNEDGNIYVSDAGNHLYFVDGLTSEKLIEYGEKIADTENYIVITGIDDEKE